MRYADSLYRLRFQILRRDNFTCQYCGQHAPDVRLEVDHIVARANGGTDDASNLVTACFACNRGKQRLHLGDSYVGRSRQQQSEPALEPIRQLLAEGPKTAKELARLTGYRLGTMRIFLRRIPDAVHDRPFGDVPWRLQTSS